MNNFCTLFDSNFLVYGLALHDSLVRNCKNFHLYIFAFDDKSYQILASLKLVNVTVISLVEFEDEKLLAVKPGRTKGEYCWTCASSTILYCLNKYNLEMCTYLDADIYFYADPSILINEIGDNDVLITRHNYSPKYNDSDTAGIYCVQFITFKSSYNGLKVLNWWRDACIEWCYDRFEDGKFGDQRYLNDWTTRFEGVHVLQNLGGGVAPWNIQQYTWVDDNILCKRSTGQVFEIVFYHFHEIKIVNQSVHYDRIVKYDKKYLDYTKLIFNYLSVINQLIIKHNIQLQQIKVAKSLIIIYLLKKYIKESIKWLISWI